MKRRWLAIALVAWVNILTLVGFLFTPGIAEAAVNCTLTNANTVTCTGTNQGTLSLPWSAQQNAYYKVSGQCGTPSGKGGLTPANPNVTLTSKNSNGSYAGTFNDGCGGSSAVTVANPNNVNPTGAPGGAGGGAGGAGGTGANTDPTTLCDAGVLTWLNCAIMSAAINLIDGIRDAIIAPFLHVTPLTTTLKGGGTNPTYTIWQNMRNVAAVMLILVFFAIIFGTALGFDNYTIKKSLPHLVAGAILMPLSWYICAVMIDIGNILGQGLLTLMDAIIPKPSVDFTQPLSLIFYGIGATVAAIALKGAVADIGLALLITIVIAVLATFFTLVLRQIIIILLVILSPFAILAWILPNTSKWFTQWWQNFFKLILMYPLIMLLFEAGRIFAVAAGTTFQGGGGASDIAKAATPILAIVGLYLPLGAVPWTFSWAGGAMKMGAGAIGRVGGSANKRFGKGSDFDKARQQRKQEKAASSYLGAPQTRLGRAMQFKTIKDDKGNVIGYEERKKMAGFARSMAATRGGFSGAFPGQAPSKVQQRAMVGVAAKAENDEKVAAAAQKLLGEQIKNGSYRPYDRRIEEGVESTIHAEQKKARNDAIAEFQRNGLTTDQIQQIAEGTNRDFGPKGSYYGSIAQEAAIQQVSKADYEWGRMRDALKAGTVTSETMRNGLQDVPSAVPKARDVALGADSNFKQENWQHEDQMDFFDGRNAGHRLAFDKTTRKEDLRRIEVLQTRLTKGETTYKNSRGETVDTAKQLATHREQIADSYAKIAASPQDWSKIDNATAKRIAEDAYHESGGSLGFNEAERNALKAVLTEDGRSKA